MPRELRRNAEAVGELMNIWRLEPDVDPGFVGVDGAKLDEIAATLREGLDRGDLLGGAQLAVYRYGKRVLDLGGGLARRRLAEPVRSDTMFVIFSSTKGVAALAMLMLYERMKFHYDEPVVKYWPAFDSIVPEKRMITIRQVMGHRGGFPHGPDWLRSRFFNDREAIRRAMEEVPLAWTPGEKNGYHALNFGHVLNELVERIDGRDCGRFLSEEVFTPLGVDDFYVGLPEDEALEARVAWVEGALRLISSVQAVGGTAVGPATATDAPPVPVTQSTDAFEIPEYSNAFNRPEVHRAVLPAAGGIATARALGRVYACLALGGELDGVRIVRQESLDHATTPTNRRGEMDQVLRFPIRWGTGWHMGGYGDGSTLRTFGHGGMGGQIAFADPDRGLAFAYCTTGELKPLEHTQWRTRLQSLAFAACRD